MYRNKIIQICIIYILYIILLSSINCTKINKKNIANINTYSIRRPNKSITKLHKQKKEKKKLFIKNYQLKNKNRINYLKTIFDNITGNQFPQNSDIDSYNLTPKLKKTVQFFQSLSNNPYNKSQEVILMGKKCPPMPNELKTRENQVLGCQSTVYIYPKVRLEDNKKIIDWLGYSDGLLTKGIVYILIDGLSGYTPEEILKVNPNFISLTGISDFLTMSRINGYLNIMNKIKIFSEQIIKNIEY
ncbi:cysteine desulfuration protein SufE, putative [Plasmodium vinckei vinckei]|uniref:Cysteine desulfuration protein SufE n=1 Tax=Plasmodium vinckei vinckei TaxID=54757 RepID=A0A081I9S8_PLAVN|nr:cysteine desulfuration protein SufE, putative [Plasmodium vinckei vinckei]KEG00436.1 cysteine desulfuration protein SufE [Plasmodium vinckei vinckei]VEV54775.1 cysteine desulfuration protein SufE, putative [Plasmodium vinckei vinckei]